MRSLVCLIALVLPAPARIVQPAIEHRETAGSYEGRQNPLNFRSAIPGCAAGLHEPGSEGELTWPGLAGRKAGAGVTQGGVPSLLHQASLESYLLLEADASKVLR